MNRFTSTSGGVELPEPPSPNGSNGDLPTANPLPGGGEENGAPPSPNGGNGARPESAAPAGERETATRAQAPSGRDGNGRFAKGNRGGPGNPFGRQMAALRQLLQAKVSDEVLERIADQLIKQAEAGDVASARLLFSYVIGKPTPAVDPDTLDVQEWKVMKQTGVQMEDWHQLVQRPPTGLVCEVMRHTLPCLEAQFAEQMSATLGRPAPRDQAQERAPVQRAPSPNGGNGDPDDLEDEELSRRASRRARQRQARHKDKQIPSKPCATQHRAR